MRHYVEFALSENDKRLLFILLIVFLIIFLLLGLIGVLIRSVSKVFSKRIDYEIHEAVTNRVITTPEQLKKYGIAKNNRLFFKQAIPPFLILAVSLLMYLIYSFATGIWAEDYFGHFSSLLYTWDWGDPENFAEFWGLTLLRRWPPLANEPHFVAEYWGAYILVPLWRTAIGYYLIIIQAYVSRAMMLEKRTHTVFEKSLEDFNYFNDKKDAPAQDAQSSTEKK